MPTSRTLSSGQPALSRHPLTKPGQQKEGRARIRSHLSVQDENVARKSKTSTSSQGTQEEKSKPIASELAKARDTQSKSDEVEVPRKTSRVFRNSKTKEVQAGSRVGVGFACLPVSRDATFITSQGQMKPAKVEEREELPKDVLNIEMEEGLYEFSQEVHAYLWQMERISSIPSSYLDQDAITGNMRAVLVDWLTQVQHHLKLSEETLFRAVIILDTVLWQRSVEPDMLQLVGITAMLLASKLEEYYPVELSKLIHLTENSYRLRQVLEMEKTILVVLDFKFITPSPQAFLSRFTRAALRSGEEEFYKTCTFLLDCHLVVKDHSSHPGSHLAAAAVLAALTLYKAAVSTTQDPAILATLWTPTLVHYTAYTISDLLVTAAEMLTQLILQYSEGSQFHGARIKYTSRSQHGQLALANHLTLRTAESAREILMVTEQ